MLQPCTYQLLIELVAPARVRVGRLGTFDFPAGQYVYTGSAKRNLASRVARHLGSEKHLRWHVDYLLAVPAARVTGVRKLTREECVVNQSTGGLILAPGFGASDCKAGCGSHLRYLPPPARAN